MLATRIKLIVVTLWVGSLWTLGYVVAPTLFATLSDRVLAGTIAGSMFRIGAWVSVASALILLLNGIWANRRGQIIAKTWFALVVGMLLCTLVGYFGLQPFMAALREAAGPSGVMQSETRTQFGILHGISSFIYLIESLLGVVLVLKSR